MKKIKKLRIILIAAVLMCSAMMMACGNNSSDDGDGTNNGASSNEVTYKVTVKDALGNSYPSGIIAQFMKDGQQVAMQVCDENGVASKNLEAGDYTVALMFTDGDGGYHYNAEGLAVSADQPETEVILSYAVNSEGRELADSVGYPVLEGCTYVTLESGKRSYFLFTPTLAGTYEFGVVGEGASIGYYGAPHFVQEMSAAEVVDNKFTVSISASMIGTSNTGTTVLVIGVDAANVTDTILTVQRIGEPEHTLADEPWTIYQTTSTLAPFSLKEGAQIQEFDLTASGYELVYNAADGFYHLDSENGPLVLVRLAKDPKYLPCFKTILDRSGITKYFFDENDEFVKKESYSECLLEYIPNADETHGVYPLTEDLKYIIQQRGDYAGWFDASNSSYLFKDEGGMLISGINPEISWLFMCCYVTEY